MSEETRTDSNSSADRRDGLVPDFPSPLPGAVDEAILSDVADTNSSSKTASVAVITAEGISPSREGIWGEICREPSAENAQNKALGTSTPPLRLDAPNEEALDSEEQELNFAGCFESLNPGSMKSGAWHNFLSLQDTVELQFKLAVLQPGGLLDSQLNRRQRDGARQGTINALRMPHPLLSLLNKLWFQGLLLAFVAGAFVFVSTWLAQETRQHQYFAWLRFTSLEQRDGQAPTAPHIQDLGPLWRGCKIPFGVKAKIEDGATLTIALDAAVHMDGCFFVTKEDASFRDPAKFRVEAAEPDADGAPPRAWEVLGRKLHFDTPEERLAEVKVPLRALWPVYLGWVAGQLVIAIGMLAGTVLGAAGREYIGMTCFEVAWMVGAVLRLGTAGGFFAQGQWKEAVYWLLLAVAALLLALTLSSSGAHFVYALTAIGVFLVMTEVLVVFRLYSYATMPLKHVPFLGICLTVLGGGFLVLLIRRRGQAFLHIGPDRRAQQQVWDTLIDPSESEDREGALRVQSTGSPSWLGSKHFKNRVRAVGSANSEASDTVVQAMKKVDRALAQEAEQRQVAEHVQATWRLVEEDLDAHGITFFLRIFDLAPHARALFSFDTDAALPLEESPGLKQHSAAVMRTVGQAVAGLRDINALIPVLQALGGKHAAFGVQPEHFAVVGEALLWTLEGALGPRWTPEVKEAWVSVFGTVQSVMEPALRDKIRKLDAVEGLKKLGAAIEQTGGGHAKLVRQYSALKPEEQTGEEARIHQAHRREVQRQMGIAHAKVDVKDLNLRRPTQSLDQLYKQAAVANCLLKHKAGDWAMQSAGSFAAWTTVATTKAEEPEPAFESLIGRVASVTSPRRLAVRAKPKQVQQVGLRKELEYVKWANVVKNPLKKKRILWRGVKEVDRSIEKLILCYDNDVSRLCDLAGQRIVFDTIKDLASCMEAIANDRDIAVSYVKNFMETPNASGFRAVVVYLRLITPEARRVNIHTHVCEVQLMLRCLVELQNPEQHQRYLAFRNVVSAGGVQTSFLSAIRMRIQRSLAGWKRHKNMNVDEIVERTSVRSKRMSLFARMPSKDIERGSSWDSLAERLPSWVIKSAPRKSLGCLEIKESNMTMEEEVQELLASSCAIGASTASNALQSKVCLASSMQHAGFISAAFSSKGAAAISCRRRWLILVFLLASAYLAAGVLALLSAAASRHTQGTVFRFTALQDRSGNLRPGSAHVREFALLLDGCPVDTPPITPPEASGPTITLRFGGPVRMNGFSFSTEASEPDKDPVRFVVESKADGEDGEWEEVGASQWRVLPSGHVQLLAASCCFTPPIQREATVDVSARAQWPWFLAFSGVQAVTACCAYTFVVLGVTGFPEQCNLLVVVGFCTVGCLQIASGAGFLANSETAEGAFWFLFAVGNLSMAAVLLVAEGWLVPALTCAGAYWVLLDLVFNLAVTWNPSALYLAPPLTGIGFLCVGSVVIVIFMVKRQRATRLIEEDRERYDELWKRIVERDDHRETLRQLEERVAAAQPDIGEMFICQFNTKHAEKLAMTAWQQFFSGQRHQRTASAMALVMQRSDEESSPLPKLQMKMPVVNVKYFVKQVYTTFCKGVEVFKPAGPSPSTSQGLTTISITGYRDRNVGLDLWNKIQSLDQLFMQAHAVNVFLKRKVKQWALHSGGCFPVMEAPSWKQHDHHFRGGGGSTPATKFVRWSELQNNALGVQHRIKWGKVKGVDRAVEKLLRTYGGDASRLLDVCRQSIVFESIAELLECFIAITSDPDVGVVRIKNRLGLKYDSSRSAGYRDVVLNLNIRHLAATELLVSCHVCEVQLLLVEFAQMKSDEGHRRYKQFRDERCE